MQHSKKPSQIRSIWVFALLHGMGLASLLLVPHVAAQIASQDGTLLAALDLVPSVVLAAIIAETVFLITVRHIPESFADTVRTLWGATIIPLTLWAFVQMRFIFATNTFVSWAELMYAVQNSREILAILTREVHVIFWIFLGLTVIAASAFAILGWRASRHNSGRPLPILLVATIALLLLHAPSGISIDSQETRAQQEYTKPRTMLETAPTVPPHADLPPVSQLIPQKQPSVLSSNAPNVNEQPNTFNIVLVVLETWRADATTPYNTDLQTTPFLARMAEEGLRASHAYASIPHTSKALVSAICGIPPYPSMKIVERKKTSVMREYCLPHVLERAGYSSAFFQPARKNFEQREELAEAMGFNLFISKEDLDKQRWEEVNYFGLEDRAMLEPAMDWVDKQQGPFFLSLLTLTSHHYYSPPSSFDMIDFAEAPRCNKYLNTVRYTDEMLRDLYAEFEQRGLTENTIFVFVGDHGESFPKGDNNDHNKKGHHNNPYDESLRVPLIVRGPNISRKVLTEPRLQLDIPPTILGIINGSDIARAYPGQSLFADAQGRIVRFTCAFFGCAGTISPQYKTVHNRGDAYEIYKIHDDSDEQTNLAPILDAEQKTAIKRHLRQWKRDVASFYNRSPLNP